MTCLVFTAPVFTETRLKAIKDVVCSITTDNVNLSSQKGAASVTNLSVFIIVMMIATLQICGQSVVWNDLLKMERSSQRERERERERERGTSDLRSFIFWLVDKISPF